MRATSSRGGAILGRLIGSHLILDDDEKWHTGGASPRDDSLKILRQWMAERCDAFVAVGGQWWQEIAGRAGIPIEAGLAMQRGLPCFLLGGLGGAAGDYVRNHPEVMRSLQNGLEGPTTHTLGVGGDL